MTPAEYAGQLRASIKSDLVDLNVSIPAKITAVNGDKVDVTPAIDRVRMNEDGTKKYEPTTVIHGVPVVNLSCGDFVINMPLKAGCNGLLIFSDYDIDNWIEGNSQPHTSRFHDLNDCFFFPAFNGGRNDGDRLEIKSDNVTLEIGANHFDVRHNGRSMINILNAHTYGAFAGWN